MKLGVLLFCVDWGVKGLTGVCGLKRWTGWIIIKRRWAHVLVLGLSVVLVFGVFSLGSGIM